MFLLQVNGERRIDSDNALFKIKHIGNEVRVDVPSCKYVFNWDCRHTISAIIPRAKYGGHMEGICGNCDGNKNNDYRTKTGVDVSKHKNKYYEIGNSYLVNDDSDQPKEE